MKKYAISFSMATLLLVGMTGCGDANQNNDLGANNYNTGQGITGQNDTGLFGGQTTGRNNQRGTGFFGGLTNDRNNQGGTGLFGGQNTNQNNQAGRGMFGEPIGQNNQGGTGMFGGQTIGQNNQGGTCANGQQYFGNQGSGQNGNGHGGQVQSLDTDASQTLERYCNRQLGIETNNNRGRTGTQGQQ